jgi:hypothetical protein
MNVFKITFSTQDNNTVNFELDHNATLATEDARLSRLIREHGLPSLSQSAAINLEADLFKRGFRSAALMVGKKSLEHKVATAVGMLFPWVRIGVSRLEHNFARLLSSPSGEEEAIALVREHPSLIYEHIMRTPRVLESASGKTALLMEILKLPLSADERENLLRRVPESISNTLAKAQNDLAIIERINNEQKPLTEIFSLDGGFSNQTPEFLLKIAHHFKYVDLREIELTKPELESTQFLEKFIENW